MTLPNVPMTAATKPTTRVFVALTAADGASTIIDSGRLADSTVSQNCIEDMSVLTVRSTGLLGTLLSERH